ncbi:MAG: TldD/PmbA family protein [Planctomycetes bacterium]|nr:TldD/PmbA family protein [Planctomycetota bacterium]
MVESNQESEVRNQEICEKALKFSKGVDAAVRAKTINHSLTRFANNMIHQNVQEINTEITISVQLDNKVAKLSTNKTDDDSLKTAVKEAIELAKVQMPIVDLPDLPSGLIYNKISRFDTETAECEPNQRAVETGKAVEIAKKHGLNSAGFVETMTYSLAYMNSCGASASHSETFANFSMTAIGPNSSGWAQSASSRIGRIDFVQKAEIASKKAVDGINPQEIPPGKYTVVLEPHAVSDILQYLIWAFNGLEAYEKRSYFTDKIGSKLFGENIQLYDNVYNQLQIGAPFGDDGIPRETLPLVEKGVVKNLAYDILTAKRAGKKPTGQGMTPPHSLGAFPSNAVMQGANNSTEQLIHSTESGVLVTHFWYIRYIDYTKLTITGMTRDGTFLINNGKIKYPIRNMRFNISIPELLNNIELFGIEALAGNIGIEAVPVVVPALKARNFNFVSSTSH